jgi:hypothetical protein
VLAIVNFPCAKTFAEESRHALKIANDKSDVADRFDLHADSNYTVRLPFSISALLAYL